MRLNPRVVDFELIRLNQLVLVSSKTSRIFVFKGGQAMIGLLVKGLLCRRESWSHRAQPYRAMPRREPIATVSAVHS